MMDSALQDALITGVRFLPTLFVLVVAVWLMVSAWLLTRARIRIADIEKQLHDDILLRAAVGQWPDWASYREAIAEGSQAASERMRLYASLTLALGLVGTVGYFILAGLVSGPTVTTTEDAARQLQQNLTFSLLGPLIGVGAHLFISFLLVRYEKRYEVLGQQVLARLQSVSIENIPVQSLERTLREEIQSFQTTLGSELVAALRQALQGFPQAAQAFGSQMSGFTSAIEGQRQLLATTADALVSTTSTIKPLTERLATLGEKLAQLPAELSGVIERFEGRTFDRERELVGAVTETREEVAKLPGLLGAALLAGGTDVAEKLGASTTAYAANLRATLEDDHRALLHQHELLRDEVREMELAWRRNVAEMIAGVALASSVAVREQVVPALQEASAELNRSAEAATARVSVQAALQEELVTRMAVIVGNWQDVAGDARLAAAAFQELRTTLDGAAQLFREVASGLDGLPARLDASRDQVGEGVRAVLESGQQHVEEVLRRGALLVAELDSRHERLERELSAQCTLVRALLLQLSESLAPEIGRGAG